MHPGGIRRRVLGAEEGAGAHGRAASDEDKERKGPGRETKKSRAGGPTRDYMLTESVD